jgi:hypothetical protein
MKTHGNWVVEIPGRMPKIEVTGDICLRRPRPFQGCRADDDDDNDSVPAEYICVFCSVIKIKIIYFSYTILNDWFVKQIQKVLGARYELARYNLI